MKSTWLKLLTLLAAALLCGYAGAQTIPTVTIESIEVKVLNAETVLVGSVAQVKKFDPTKYEPREITIAVKETLKGKAQQRMNVYAWLGEDELEQWRANATPLLITVPAGDDARDRSWGTSFMHVRGAKFPESKADFTLVRDGDLLNYVRQLLAKNPEGTKVATIVVRQPDSDLGKRWLETRGRGPRIDGLRVPVDKHLEARAHSDLRSKSMENRLRAIEALHHFKSDANTQRIKPLLGDPAYRVEQAGEDYMGMETRHYVVRERAHQLLSAWGVKVEMPVTRATINRVDEVERIHIWGRVRDDVLQQLSAFKRLKRLEFHQPLTDSQVALVGRLAGLTELDLSNTGTADADLAQLVRLTHLRKLQLNNNPVTDEGVAVLGDLPALLEVDLSGTEVTDIGLGRLRRARPKLKVLPVKAVPVASYYVQMGYLAPLQGLIGRQPNSVHDRDSVGNTPLHLAVIAGRQDFVQLLLDSGAKVDAENKGGETPMTLGAEPKRNFYLMRYLVSRGANVKHANNKGDTALHKAIAAADATKVSFLLRAGANVLAKNSQGQTPFDLASSEATGLRTLLSDWAAMVQNASAFGPAVPMTSAQCQKMAYELHPSDANLAFWTTESVGRLVWPLRWNKSPSGRDFIGPFNQQAVRLHLTDLAPHQNLRIELELWVISSWDGNGDGAGPDIVDIRVPGVGTLMHASFFNNTEDGREGLPIQSFPDRYGLGFHKGYTGAIEERTLGFNTRYGRSAIYKVVYTFAHNNPELALVLTGLTEPQPDAQRIEHDEHWGIAKLVVKTD